MSSAIRSRPPTVAAIYSTFLQRAFDQVIHDVCLQDLNVTIAMDRAGIVGADGPDPALFTALNTLIAQRRVPVMIAISISNGSGDAQGSQRGLEYDTMSGLYAEFVEKEVLPLVEKQYNVKLTKDPEARATMPKLL